MYHIIGYQTNPITGETIYNILCDTVADLPSSPVSDNGYGGEIGQGSKAVIIADGSSYLADSNRQWIYQPNPNAWVNVYTKSEIDSILSGYQEILTWDPRTIRDSVNAIRSGEIWYSVWGQMLDLNTYPNLAAGDDLNDFTTPGIYRCTNSTTAASLLNMPSPLAQQAGGRLIVSTLGGSGRVVQIYISSGTRFWIRSNIATSFQHWFEYVGNDTGA